MIDFGYSISPSSTIDISTIDHTIYNQLIDKEPDILKCMACGSCAASCSANKYTTISFRRVILLLNRGEEKEALSQISSCMLCGKCNIVCPRGINTRNIIINILSLYKMNHNVR